MRNSLIAFLVLIFGNVSAQTDSSYIALHQFDTIHCKFNGSYLKSYWNDTKSVLASPAHWKIKDFSCAALFVATDIFLYSQDKNIQIFFQRNRNSFTNNLASVFKPFGNGAYIVGADALLYGVSLIAKNKKLKHETLEAAKSLLFTGVSALIIKEIARRQRPYVTGDPHNWFGPFNNDEYVSFYSGHSTVAFTWATNISWDSKRKILPILAYTIASGAALSRLNDNEHWVSDVFTGVVMSTYITNKIFKVKNW